jgi:hypothetical protein
MRIFDDILSFENKQKDSIFDDLKRGRETTFWRKIGDFFVHHDQVSILCGNLGIDE